MLDAGTYIGIAITFGVVVVCGIIFAIRIVRSDLKPVKSLEVMTTSHWYK